eukprot:4847355-Prymnesium_polylepis.2
MPVWLMRKLTEPIAAPLSCMQGPELNWSLACEGGAILPRTRSLIPKSPRSAASIRMRTNFVRYLCMPMAAIAAAAAVQLRFHLWAQKNSGRAEPPRCEELSTVRVKQFHCWKWKPSTSVWWCTRTSAKMRPGAPMQTLQTVGPNWNVSCGQRQEPLRSTTSLPLAHETDTFAPHSIPG